MQAEIVKVDISEQTLLLTRVDDLLDTAREGRSALHQTYVEIGLGLSAVKKSGAWVLRTHSWDSYVKSCEDRFGKARTALYGYVACAERLLPEITKEQLIEIGISKAMPLAMYVKRTGKSPAELLNKALDTKVDIAEFRAAISEAQHEKPEKGKWYDFGGAFLTADEKIEMDAALELAETIEPLPEDVSDCMVRKIVMQRLVAEFMSTYGHLSNPKEVNGRPTLDGLRSER